MTRSETVKVVDTIITAYPRSFADICEDKAKKTIDLWAKLLGGYSFEEVLAATEQHIVESQFIPTIADIAMRIPKPSIYPDMTGYKPD